MFSARSRLRVGTPITLGLRRTGNSGVAKLTKGRMPKSYAGTCWEARHADVDSCAGGLGQFLAYESVEDLGYPVGWWYTGAKALEILDAAIDVFAPDTAVWTTRRSMRRASAADDRGRRADRLRFLSPRRPQPEPALDDVL
jgi:hypothetical protein